MAGVGRRKAGQAMVESAVVLVVLFVAFFLALQYADNLRAKLLAEYAAFRCARARTVGYNDYKLLKTARMAMLSASGKCRTTDDEDRPLSTGALVSRMGLYLGSVNEGQARTVLDCQYWDDDATRVDEPTVSGGRITVKVEQSRPQFFDLANPSAGAVDANGVTPSGATRAHLVGESSIEAHYPEYLQ